MTPAIFVGARPVLTNRFGLRFQAMVLNGVNVKADFELLQNATVVRNGQPARLFDLRAGDQLLIYQSKQESPEVIRVEASSP